MQDNAPQFRLEPLPDGLAKLTGGCITVTGNEAEIIRAMRLCVPESLQIAGIPNGPADTPPASNG